jgi:superfamily II RNA helicase
MQMYLGATKTAAAVKAAKVGGSDASMELIMAEGAEFALQQLTAQLPQLAPQLAQAAKVVQSKMPQPPVDPAVQKTFEAAMAEIERKKAVDAANDKREQMKIASDTQLKQMSQAQDAKLADQKLIYDLQINAAREHAQKLSDELRAQVELMKNAQDNQQHQHTEIVKNLQDNYTQLQLAMEQGLTDVRNTLPQSPDITPIIDQLNGMLAKVEQQKSSDALGLATDTAQESIRWG